jgi:phosphoribosylformimino-5-aminoimidazole carboxamide ribotide isomerase
MMPRLVGVLDVKGGVVVRGVGGRRAEYRPLPGAPSPLEAARALGVGEVYLADLDAIEGAAPALAVYRSLAAEFRLWVDAGVRTAADRARLAGPWRTVVGLETAEDPAVIRPGDCFSIDLRDGQPMGRWGDDVMAIARTAAAAGAAALLVLDLARVGGAAGTGTEALCAALRAAHPGVELLAGGGVRHHDDLARLAAAGVDAALVGTALRELIA